MPDRKFSRYDNWPDAVLIVGRDGCIVFANSRTEQLFGYEAGALSGQSVELLVPERIRGGHRTLREDFFRNPRILKMGAAREVHGVGIDGQQIPLEVALGPAADGPYVVAVMRDISEIVESRRALQKSEECLREAQEIAKIGSWVWDVGENTVWWSEEIYRLFGQDAGTYEPSYEAFLERVHPKDRQLVQDDLQRALDNQGTKHSVDHRIVLADGTERLVNSQGAVTFDETGRPLRMVGTMQDITERVLARQALQRALADAEDNAALSQSILDSMVSHVALLDAQGTIIEVNDAWVEFASENGAASKLKAGVGVKYLDVCRRAADDDPDAQRALSGILSVLDGSRDVFGMEYDCHAPSQRRWYAMTVTAMKTDNGGAVVTHTDITERMIVRRELERTLKEVAHLRDQLQDEQHYLRDEIKNDHDFDDIIGRSGATRAVLSAVGHVAKTDATVLLHGETGTGKELVARAIHANSERSERPLIKVDCATLPGGLVESELFGHVKGAFTGATTAQSGRFELADGGTIFLDEIGELSTELQAKLLRVLQEGEIQRLGAREMRIVDVRVIAATNRNLKREVEEGRFRADLFYRLNVFPIEIPPLRHRGEDIPLLTAFFVSKCASRFGKRIESVPTHVQKALAAYDWPGNVRELQNVVERSVILSPGSRLELAETLGDGSESSAAVKTSLKEDLRDIERRNILQTLEACEWKIKGEDNAASRLGLKPSTLRSRMKSLGVSRSSDGIQ